MPEFYNQLIHLSHYFIIKQRDVILYLLVVKIFLLKPYFSLNARERAQHPVVIGHGMKPVITDIEVNVNLG